MKVKREKVKIITLGCSKNLVDSEYLLAQLKANDIEITDDDKKADTKRQLKRGLVSCPNTSFTSKKTLHFARERGKTTPDPIFGP